MTPNAFIFIIKEVRKMFKIVEFSTAKEFSLKEENLTFPSFLERIAELNLSKLPGSNEMHVVSKMKLLEAN